MSPAIQEQEQEQEQGQEQAAQPTPEQNKQAAFDQRIKASYYKAYSDPESRVVLFVKEENSSLSNNFFFSPRLSNKAYQLLEKPNFSNENVDNKTIEFEGEVRLTVADESLDVNDGGVKEFLLKDPDGDEIKLSLMNPDAAAEMHKNFTFVEAPVLHPHILAKFPNGEYLSIRSKDTRTSEEKAQLPGFVVSNVVGPQTYEFSVHVGPIDNLQELKVETAFFRETANKNITIVHTDRGIIHSLSYIEAYEKEDGTLGQRRQTEIVLLREGEQPIDLSTVPNDSPEIEKIDQALDKETLKLPDLSFNPVFRPFIVGPRGRLPYRSDITSTVENIRRSNYRRGASGFNPSRYKSNLPYGPDNSYAEGAYSTESPSYYGQGDRYKDKKDR